MSQTYSLLNNGNKMPFVGLGTWESSPGEVGEAIKQSVEAGYRHIDCAAIYLNEKEVGNTFKELFDSGIVKREELFITSKLWNTCHAKENVRDACLNTLKDLQLEYLDLYLIHWPICMRFGGVSLTPENCFPKNEQGKVDHVYVSIQETWQAMEALVEEGLVKSIGISNFNVVATKDLLSYAKIRPVVNQIELHPFLPQNELLEYLASENIKATAYSPLGRANVSGPISDPDVVEIAKKYNKTPAQVLIRWAVERNTIVIPKSVRKERVIENFNVFDFQLTEEEVKKISTGKRVERVVNAFDIFGLDIFS